MKFQHTAITAAILSVYAGHGVAQSQPRVEQDAEASKRTPNAAAQNLAPIDVEAHGEGRYKVEQAQSPKFTAPLLDTPQSVSVISEDVLRDTAATSLEEAVRRVPGITFLAGEGGQPIADRPVIRGFNSTSNLFVDGVRDIGDQTRDVFDLESIEIIKGADSVYAGRGSGGGSINLVSKTAQLIDFGRAAFTVGTADKFRGTIDKNWAIGDNVGFRIGVLGETSGVPGRDDAVDYDKYGVSPSLTFRVGEATRVTLDYYHLTDNGIPDYSIPYDLASGLPVTETMDVDADNFYGLVDRDFRYSDTDIGTVFLEHKLTDSLRLRNVTRVGRSQNEYVVTNPDDSRGNVANGFVYRSTKNRASETTTFANQLDLSGEFRTWGYGHSFDVGLEVSREKRDADGFDVVSATDGLGSDCSGVDGAALIANGDCTSLFNPTPYDDWQGTISRTNDPTQYQTDVVAVYAFDTVAISPHWLVSAGLRWDNYNTEAKTPSDPSSNVDSSDSFVNYNVGVVYKPVDAGSFYISHGTSTTPAPLASNDSDAPAGDTDGRRGFTPANTGLQPEETSSYEIGTKWEVLDRRLALNAAVFRITRENAYIQTGPDDTTDYAYAGKTRVQGFELGAAGRITDNWQVFGGYSYLDSELVEGGFQNDAEGKQLTNVPKNSATLFTNYAVLPTVTVGGGATYTGEVFGSRAVVAPKRIPDYWRLDANASWRVSPGATFRLNVLNFTDEVFYTKAYAAHYAARGIGRQVLLSVDIDLD